MKRFKSSNNVFENIIPENNKDDVASVAVGKKA